MAYLAVCCRAGLATVFLLAVAGKAAGRRPFREFAGSIARMRVLPPRAAVPVAAVTISAEAAIAVMIMSPFQATGIVGCLLAAVLSVTFSVAVVVSLRRGNRAPCRCFGRSVTPLGARHVIRDAILLAFAAAGAVTCAAGGTAHAAGAAVAAGAGLFLGLAIAAYDELAALVFPIS